MKAVITWILIANGAKARVLEAKGVGKGVAALPELVFEQEPLRPAEIMADRPGRTFESASTGRHAMAYPSEPERERERAFASMLTETLRKAHKKGAFERLVLVAPPQALGDLRAALPLDLKRALKGTLTKDLTHTPNAKIAGHLEELLAV